MKFYQKMNSELFSIIMPAFNAENTISISICSVLNQTNKNFKLYIINDGSNDNTKNIIKSFSDDRIVYIENNKNLGVSKSRNIGIQCCEGKYIAFLDSDDIWLPTKLEEQLVFLEKGWDIVCSNYTAFDKKLNMKERLSPEIINYTDMFKTNLIGNLTGVYNRERLGNIFQKEIGHEDYVMWLNLIRKSKKAYCIQKSLAKYRILTNSLSANKLKALQWQWFIYRNELNLSIFRSLYYFLFYIINSLKKKNNR